MTSDAMAGPGLGDNTQHVIVWFRRDLRLADNPAWSDAVTSGAESVHPVFVLDPVLWASVGSIRRSALACGLRALDASLANVGARLRVVSGEPATELGRLATELGATALVYNADTTPYAVRRDRAVDEHLATLEVEVRQHWGNLVHPPGTVRTNAGTVSLVFTPFYKRWARLGVGHIGETEPSVRRLDATTELDLDSLSLDGAHDSPTVDLSEPSAHRRLEEFLERLDRYPTDRDVPGTDGTSQLSIDLHFGTISPRHVLGVVEAHAGPGADAFIRQLAWRDWYAHLFVEHPHLQTHPLKADRAEIAWNVDPQGLDAWKHGQTGYPIVDAGMRQLLETGWMHNRVRMVVASFLVKDLLIDWREGERWFRRLLLDADISQNAGNWQWVAGTGPDAAPYFRVMNPVAQSKRWDPEGTYLRRWVPELAPLDNDALHEPWTAPLECAAAGIQLGVDYPQPIVAHDEARIAALAAYGRTR